MRALKSRDQVKDTWWTQKQCCLYRNIDPKTFRKWGLEPVATFGKNKYYLAPDVFSRSEDEAIKGRLVEGEDGGFVDLQEEQARKTKQERIRLELQNARTMREQVPVELLTYALDNGINQMVAVLDGVALTVKRENPDVPMSVLDIVSRELAAARNAIADTTIDWNGLAD